MSDVSEKTKILRRNLLKAAATAGLGAALISSTKSCSRSVPRSEWHSSVAAYLESLSRSDGGYGWNDQSRSHLTPTFAVIGCHRILDLPIPRKRRLAEFIRTHHPSALKKLEQPQRVFTYQQIQSLLWLGEEVAGFRESVTEWKEPLLYMKRYERNGYPVFQSESTVIVCRALLGMPSEELPPSFSSYLDLRRRPNGSFNNVPACDGGDGHVMNTWWGLRALQVLGRTGELSRETIEWLRSCQLPAGGFTYQPEPEFAGVDDVVYTWAALRGLRLLGASPSDPEACSRYLFSLLNGDGGFGGRCGWESNPLATYYALDSLRVLNKLQQKVPDLAPVKPRSARLPSNLEVFSIQIQALGTGSPTEAVDLAESLKIHLWGAKNARPGWIEKAQQVAHTKGVPVTFFVANEEYGTWLQIPGMGTYSHISDLIAPLGKDFGSSLAGNTAFSWPEFQSRRVAPLQEANGRLIWQFGENEELAKILLDDSLQRPGFAAISTFHFGNPDFTNTEPFLKSYRGQIPFIALQDAHGHEPWWLSDMITGFRTVFLAREPSWEGWLEALRRNWVAAIRHDAVSGFNTWMHGGSDPVVDFIQDHASNWQWWENPQIQRPMVSIVVVRPEDTFEVARPVKGVTLRVRCAWENSAHGSPRKPLAELLRLKLDGEEIGPQQVEVVASSPRDPADIYYRFDLPEPRPGIHQVQAVVRRLQDGKTFDRMVKFRF